MHAKTTGQGQPDPFVSHVAAASFLIQPGARICRWSGCVRLLSRRRWRRKRQVLVMPNSFSFADAQPYVSVLLPRSCVCGLVVPGPWTYIARRWSLLGIFIVVSGSIVSASSCLQPFAATFLADAYAETLRILRLICLFRMSVAFLVSTYLLQARPDK